jgi:hypothetical protein
MIVGIDDPSIIEDDPSKLAEAVETSEPAVVSALFGMPRLSELDMSV